jgi:hypothetical protein
MTQPKLLIILFAIYSALPIKAEQSNFRFINLANYQRLTGSQRTSYTKGLQLAIAELESSLQRNGMDVSLFDLLDSILPRSFAATKKGAWGPKCVIGGVIRSTINGICPTFGRGCKSQTDGFQCGKIYGKEDQACISRVPPETISERCKEVGNNYQISGDDYAAISQDLDSGIKEVCMTAPEKGRDVCDKFWGRVSELNEKHKKAPPAQLPWKKEKNNEKEKEEKNEGKLQNPDSLTVLATKNACDPNRDQGNNGTCHAFCLTCVYDNAMARAKKDSKPSPTKPFRVSANWIAMISVVKRMCDDPRSFHKTSDEMLKVGWSPGDNLQIIEAVGACAEEDYIPYDNQAKDWGAQFHSKETVPTRGMNDRPGPEFAEQENSNWEQKFGIKPEVAYDLFCPQQGKSLEDTLQSYEQRLAELSKPEHQDKPNEKFIKCAKAALENSKKLKLGGTSQGKGSCKNIDFAKDNDRVNSLKKMLKEGQGPLPIVITTSTDGHGYHCVTVTGYDDKKEVFHTINSWGTSQEHRTLPYKEADRFLYATGKDCPLVTGPKSSSGAPAGGPPPAKTSGQK